MRTHNWLLLILISLILTQPYEMSFASSLTAESNSVNWPMFRHDPNHSGYTTSNGTANSAKLLWAYETSAAIWSSPAVVDGRVFVGSKDCNIYCLNSSNGELLWNFTTVHEVNSSPAVSDGNVYVGSYDGWVYCLDVVTGLPVWISFVGGFVLSSPVVVDGRLFIGSGSHDFFCFNASDGTLLWSFPTLSPVDSSPAISSGVVHFATEDYHVYALNSSTGREIWRRHTGSVVSSPSISNGYVYIGSKEGYVVGLNASTGAQIWKYQTENSVSSSPAIAYGHVYVGSEDNNVYCLNASDGGKIWQAPTGYWVWSSPAIADGNVYVGSEDYSLYCFDAFTGEKKYSYETGNYVDSSPAIVNGVLYVGSHDHNVYAFSLCDSTVENLPSQFANLMWTTVAINVIACAVGVLAILALGLFVYSKKKAKQATQSMNLSGEKPSWFLAHTEALYFLAILGFSAVFFANLGSGHLWVADEKTYSQMAFHMFKTGDYLTPYAFGDLAIWTGKPPLFMWLMSLSYQVFGVNNFATRFWNPMFGTLSLVLIFYLGKKLYNLHVGFLSAVVLGTFFTFFEFARHAMTDVPLIFFILASIYFSLLASEQTQNTTQYAALSGLFFGLALMTKLVSAFLTPLIFLPYLAVTQRSIRFLFTKRTVLFLGVAALIFTPWLIYMSLSFRDFWDCYFVYSTFTRAVSPIEGHAGGYLFYFSYLVNRENPLWVTLLPFAAGLCAFNSLIKRQKSDTLILGWIAIVLLVFTLAQTKLEWYLLPAYPAFAITISNLLYQASRKVQLHRYRKNG